MAAASAAMMSPSGERARSTGIPVRGYPGSGKGRLPSIQAGGYGGYASAHCCLRYLRARASEASGVSVNFDSIVSQPE